MTKKYRVVNGCSYRDPNPTPEAVEAARRLGRSPEIRMEIGDEIDTDAVPAHVIAQFLQMQCLVPVGGSEAATATAPASDAGD